MEEKFGIKDLTLEQRFELINKERIYGVVFAIKHENGDIEIVGLGEKELY